MIISKILKTLFFFLFFLISHNLFSQSKTDKILFKVNVLNKETRLKFTNTPIKAIYLNIDAQQLDLEDHLVPLCNIKLSYSYQAWDQANKSKKYHAVRFSCISSGNCIILDDGSVASAVTIFFKTKKDCYDFLNLINELRSNIE